MNRLTLVTFLTCLLAGQYAPAAANKTITSSDTITAGQEWGVVSIWDTSPGHTTVTMSGGLVGTMAVHDYSSLNMSGGSAGLLNGNQNATLTLSGAASVSTLLVLNSAILNMNGGTVYDLGLHDQAIANLRGGSITDMLIARDSSLVNVFGTSLAKTSSGGPFGYGRITGFWQDNSPFVINLGNTETYSHVNLVTIPEPVTLLLFAAGIPLLRRFRKHI